LPVLVLVQDPDKFTTGFLFYKPPGILKTPGVLHFYNAELSEIVMKMNESFEHPRICILTVRVFTGGSLRFTSALPLRHPTTA